LEDTIVIFTSDNGGDVGQIEEQQARDKGFKNNGDLRGDKHTIWEGGFKVPFVVSWPKMIQEGSQSDRMINIVDIYATLQELVAGKILDHNTAAPDSFSFYSALGGEKSEDTIRITMVMNDVKGIVAVRMNEWKYIENKAERPADKARQEKNPNLARPQLYNLKRDPVEANNVIDEFPEIAKKMQETLNRIRRQGSERLVAREETNGI
jgi:arylsulfatase A-like enzyme